jgi:hypothetical protein
MPAKSLAEELAEVRLTLARLKRRERQLELLLAQAEPQASNLRPGWPIQRVGAVDSHPH